MAETASLIERTGKDRVVKTRKAKRVDYLWQRCSQSAQWIAISCDVCRLTLRLGCKLGLRLLADE